MGSLIEVDKNSKKTSIIGTALIASVLALTSQIDVSGLTDADFQIGYGGTNVERLDWNKTKFIESPSRSLRFALPWEQIEPTQNAANLDPYFANLDGYDGVGKTLDPVFWIGYNPGWIARMARNTGKRPWQLHVDNDSSKPTYFTRFVSNFSQAFTQRYPGRKLTLEIGNEVDCVEPTNTDCFTGPDGVTAYAEVLKEVRAAVHQVDDSATVTTSGLALELLPPFKFSFFRELVENYPADSPTPCFDAATIHFYSDLRNYSAICNQAPDCSGQSYKDFWNLKGGRGISSKINYVTDTLSQHGYPEGFPIYITEAGTGLRLPNPSANYDFTPPANVHGFYQETLVREITRASSFRQVKAMYWYSIKDEAWMYGPESWRCQSEISTCTSYGMHRLDLSEKSNVWQSFKNLARRENGQNSQKIEGQSSPFEGYYFSAASPDFIVAWSNTNQPITFRPPFFEYDVEGADGSLLENNKRGALTLDSHPVFIVKEDVEPSATLAPTSSETAISTEYSTPERTSTENPPSITPSSIFTQMLTATPIASGTIEPVLPTNTDTPTKKPTANSTNTPEQKNETSTVISTQPTPQIQKKHFINLPSVLRLLLK